MNISKLTQDIGLEKYFTPEQFKSLPLELRYFILDLQTCDMNNFKTLKKWIDYFKTFNDSEIFKVMSNIQDGDILGILANFMKDKSEEIKSKLLEFEIAITEDSLAQTLQ